MVGVPGRSKACVTCRKRRKGCDFGRPTCAQCRKHGLECGGYENQRVFVVSTPDARQAGYSVLPRTSTVERGTSSSQKHPSSGPQSWSRPRTIKTQRNHISDNGISSTTADLRLLSRPENERRCIDLFWEAYFPSGQPIPHPAIRSYTCTWAETARYTWQDEDSLRYALWANSLLLAGRRHKEEWMVRESSRMYGKALSGLRKSLSASLGVKKVASIAIVKLLSMFEALVHQEQSSSTPDDWQHHNAGELALFVARKPEAHQDGDAHHIYADERVEMALASILKRKKLVLSDPSWKTVPWQVTPKNLKDVLVDVLVDMPGLVEEFDIMVQRLQNLEQSSNSPAQRTATLSAAAVLRDKLMEKCWEYDRQLLVWSRLVFQLTRQSSPGVESTNIARENHHGSANMNRTYDGRRLGCQGPPEAGTDKAPQAGNDSDQQALVIHIAQVHGMSLYWTTSLVLYTILQAASNIHFSFEPQPVTVDPTLPTPDEDMPLLADRFNPLSHAQHLADALSILLQPSAGLYGHRSAALPLDVALAYVGRFGSLRDGSNWNEISPEEILGRLKKLKERMEEEFY